MKDVAIAALMTAVISLVWTNFNTLNRAERAEKSAEFFMTAAEISVDQALSFKEYIKGTYDIDSLIVLHDGFLRRIDSLAFERRETK